MYVHAGYPKTGTTTIQQFLKRNRGVLKDIGVLYPKTGIHGTGHVEFAMPFLSKQYLNRMQKSNLLGDGDSASQIKKQIGHKPYDEVIHRDNLVVTGERE